MTLKKGPLRAKLTIPPGGVVGQAGKQANPPQESCCG